MSFFLTFSIVNHKIKFCKFHNNREITRMPLKFLLLHDTPNLKANSRNTAFYVYHRAYHEPKAYYDFFSKLFLVGIVFLRLPHFAITHERTYPNLFSLQ